MSQIASVGCVTTARPYVARLSDGLLDELLGSLPAVLVAGPRATGKTTTARRHAKSVVRLDRATEAAAFRADPDVALEDLEEPVLLDEWQAVPEVLGAVKRAVDDEARPGRFLLTGSARTDAIRRRLARDGPYRPHHALGTVPPGGGR